ncbi:hypothetical protein Tco_0496376 [Tanacetum coccineum]
MQMQTMPGVKILDAARQEVHNSWVINLSAGHPKSKRALLSPVQRLNIYPYLDVLANIFIKALPRERFIFLVEKLGIKSMSSEILKNMANEEEELVKALNLLKKGLMVRGEAVEASKRRRSMLDYRIQQLSKGSSEGSGITLEVLDELKDNSGSSSSSLS